MSIKGDESGESLDRNKKFKDMPTPLRAAGWDGGWSSVDPPKETHLIGAHIEGVGYIDLSGIENSEMAAERKVVN